MNIVAFKRSEERDWTPCNVHFPIVLKDNVGMYRTLLQLGFSSVLMKRGNVFCITHPGFWKSSGIKRKQLNDIYREAIRNVELPTFEKSRSNTDEQDSDGRREAPQSLGL